MNKVLKFSKYFNVWPVRVHNKFYLIAPAHCISYCLKSNQHLHNDPILKWNWRAHPNYAKYEDELLYDLAVAEIDRSLATSGLLMELSLKQSDCLDNIALFRSCRDLRGKMVKNPAIDDMNIRTYPIPADVPVKMLESPDFGRKGLSGALLVDKTASTGNALDAKHLLINGIYLRRNYIPENKYFPNMELSGKVICKHWYIVV